MKYTPVILQEILHSLIRKLRETPEQFVRRPGRDFTRPRTLSFETVISLLLTMSENSVYDLQNGIYTDKIVQKEHEKNENAALCTMVDRSAISGPVILLADRGYEACNNLAHLERKGWKYLIRLRDKNRAVAYGLKLPDTAQFDIPVQITLGRLTARQLERQGLVVPASYYRIPPQMTFDDLEPKSTGFAALSFRIVRIETENNNTELLITNLDSKRFPPEALKRLYAMRWGIETSFRSLKYAVGLIHLHAKKPDLVLQEIFASFLIFDFTQASIWAVDTTQGASKYTCHVNFSDAVFVCCAFLREPIFDPLLLLQRKLLPVRPDRTAPRPKITGNRISSCYASAR